MAAGILVVSIVIIGTMPWWLSDMILKSTEILFTSVK